MKKIIYKFCDGTKQEIEVTNEFYATYQEMEKELKSNERKETRRHTSLNYLNDNNFEPIAPDSDILLNFCQLEENDKLKIAISRLNPAQQELLRRVFFFNEKMSDIAKELGISRSAVTQQINVILERIKEIYRKL